VEGVTAALLQAWRTVAGAIPLVIAAGLLLAAWRIVERLLGGDGL